MSNLSTALEIQSALSNAVNDDVVLDAAREFFIETTGTDYPSEEAIRALFRYTAILASTVGANVTEVLLTESEMSSMVSDINEMYDLTKDVLGE